MAITEQQLRGRLYNVVGEKGSVYLNKFILSDLEFAPVYGWQQKPALLGRSMMGDGSIEVRAWGSRGKGLKIETRWTDGLKIITTFANVPDEPPTADVVKFPVAN